MPYLLDLLLLILNCHIMYASWCLNIAFREKPMELQKINNKSILKHGKLLENKK